MNPQDIRIILTEKSDTILDDIVKKYALYDAESAIDTQKPIKLLSAAKNFSRGEMNQTDLTNLLKKDLSVSQETAAQLSNYIIKNLVPSFKKISEADLSKLSEDEKDALVFGQTKKNETEKPENLNTIKKSATTNVEENAKLNEMGKSETLLKTETTEPLSVKPVKKINRPIRENIEETGKLPKKSIAQPPRQKSSGPDSYREPVG